MIHSLSKPRTRALVAAALLALAGCRVGPDYVPPEPDVPDAWHGAAMEGFDGGTAPLHEWWTALDDPVLVELIDRAGRGNPDLEIAYARIRQARAVLGVASGERVPDIDGTGFAERSRSSEGFSPFIPPGIGRTDNFYGLGVSGAWELDLWGRISRNIESAGAALEGSVESYRDLLVVLFAEVGAAYVDVRALQQRIGFVEANVDRQRGTTQLTRNRFEAGLAPELDVQQSELNVAATESSLPTLRQALARATHRLGVLVGDHPGALRERLGEPAPLPVPPASSPTGIPAEVVRQRPDVRAAEREVARRTADIGVATAALYPTFGLSGAFGFQSVSELLDDSNRAWSIRAEGLWNLFDGGRVRGNIALQEAEAEESLAAYESAVLLALEEVENALVAYQQERERARALARTVQAATRSVELVKELYRSGLTDFQNVLDTERALFVQQDALAESEGQVVQNWIGLYRALGGGWRVSDAEESAAVIPTETSASQGSRP